MILVVRDSLGHRLRFLTGATARFAILDSLRAICAFSSLGHTHSLATIYAVRNAINHNLSDINVLSVFHAQKYRRIALVFPPDTLRPGCHGG